MFAEGSVYDPPGDDGVRCLVMRTWPRGIAYARVDVWLKELGPTPDLPRALDAGWIHWGQFALTGAWYGTTDGIHERNVESVQRLRANVEVARTIGGTGSSSRRW